MTAADHFQFPQFDRQISQRRNADQDENSDRDLQPRVLHAYRAFSAGARSPSAPFRVSESRMACPCGLPPLMNSCTAGFALRTNCSGGAISTIFPSSNMAT